VWTLPESTRRALRGQLEEKFEFLFEQLGAVNTDSLVARWVREPARIRKPQPEALKALAV